MVPWLLLNGKLKIWLLSRFFKLERTSDDQRKKFIKPTDSFVKEFDDYIITLKNLVL